jgi:hypothetical protein
MDKVLPGILHRAAIHSGSRSGLLGDEHLAAMYCDLLPQSSQGPALDCWDDGESSPWVKEPAPQSIQGPDLDCWLMDKVLPGILHRAAIHSGSRSGLLGDEHLAAMYCDLLPQSSQGPDLDCWGRGRKARYPSLLRGVPREPPPAWGGAGSRSAWRGP